VQKREKSDLYSFTIFSYRRQTRFIFFHYSSTPILRIQLTSATDKKADNYNLPTAVIYTRYGVDDRRQRPDSIVPGALTAWNQGLKMNLPAASRGVSLKVNSFYRSKLRGIKPCRFRIALKVIRVIRVICEICGLKKQPNGAVYSGFVVFIPVPKFGSLWRTLEPTPHLRAGRACP
jgi:hypothetical protein